MFDNFLNLLHEIFINLLQIKIDYDTPTYGRAKLTISKIMGPCSFISPLVGSQSFLHKSVKQSLRRWIERTPSYHWRCPRQIVQLLLLYEFINGYACGISRELQNIDRTYRIRPPKLSNLYKWLTTYICIIRFFFPLVHSTE